MKKGGATYFYHYNAHGDVIALTDAQGNVVARYEYDTWGQIRSQTGALVTENPYRYAGYQYDEETGLYYLIARYYHPTHGVFLSMDPDPGDSDDILTQNGYTYANNNPVMMVDPDGKYAIVRKYINKYDREFTRWSKNKYVSREVGKGAASGAVKGAIFGGLAGSGWSAFIKYIKVGKAFGGLVGKKTIPRVGAMGGAVIGYHLGASKGAIGGYGKHLFGKFYVWSKSKYKSWRKNR
ncbi:RHS repeat-associated core domain-containing protein [Anoxybacillus sp. PDR2]|uniref:RHS repeat-associated core domain-containing protein n=1 Tax=Anoxybacillus sp. PDR2 TaxID=1636720 RepID=UPI001F20A1B4|nr:RHS repeat-associated core domain-containing protein [Anoxybacillus sp. PDR2]